LEFFSKLLDDQLSAITMLGSTASHTAFEFLVALSQWKFVEEQTDHCLGGYTGTGRYRLRFPNARGELAVLLNDNRLIFHWEVEKIRDQGLVRYVPPAQSRLGPIVDKRVYGILTAAIETLSEGSWSTTSGTMRRLPTSVPER
jgi:hypothetical protein